MTIPSFFAILVYKQAFVLTTGVPGVLRLQFHRKETDPMKRIQTLNSRNLKESLKVGGCGECQTSCQSACKTSCTVANQHCENKKK